jgi:membrane-associated phospholipid phosphatase
MNETSIFKRAYAEVRRPFGLIALLLVAIVLCAMYPSDLESYPILPAGTATPHEVRVTEDYVRFIPTAVQIAVPLVLGDKIGLVQLAYVGISTTIATHGLKNLLDNRWIMDTRLGRRPERPSSHGNMPSGHSSMVSCAVYFIGRRYSIWLALPLALIMLMTMYARVMLNMHTISAVCAGALIGFLCTALFTSKKPAQPSSAP